MFSTTLKQVTGYFDRHALVSAFFPNLIFLGATLGLIIHEQYGWQSAIESWEKMPASLQGIFLVSFLFFVAFCTFLTLNFQSALLRLYEGYWSIPSALASSFQSRRLHHYQKQWAALKIKDSGLGAQQSKLYLENKQLNVLLNDLPKLEISNPLLRLSELEDKIKPYIPALKKTISNEILQPNTVLAENLRSLWQVWRDGNSLSKSDKEEERWTHYYKILDSYTGNLKRVLDEKLSDIEKSRYQLNRIQFLFFPLSKSDVLPTQLGNIMRAAELYSQQRYNLDALVIWPRLQNTFSKDFSDGLQSAKTSLDLMITLSALSVLFGLPFSIWLSLRAENWFLWIIPFTFSILACMMQQWKICFSAVISLCLSFLIPVLTLSPVQPFLVRLQVLITLSCGVLLVSRLSYQNAIQAAISYSELIKTAFDLYRWKAIEALNLKLPKDLAEEKLLWADINGLLYRGYADNLDYYQYQLPRESTPLKNNTDETDVVVSLNPMKAYDEIDLAHLKNIKIADNEIPDDALMRIEEAAHLCPVVPLAANTPIRRGQLIERSLLNGRAITGLSATPAMTLGGNLQTGDILNLYFDATDNTPHLIENVILLNIKSIKAESSFDHPANAYTEVLTVGIPEQTVSQWQNQRLINVVSVVRSQS